MEAKIVQTIDFVVDGVVVNSHANHIGGNNEDALIGSGTWPVTVKTDGIQVRVDATSGVDGGGSADSYWQLAAVRVG